MFVLKICIRSLRVILGTIGVKANMSGGGDEGSSGRETRGEDVRMERGERKYGEVGIQGIMRGGRGKKR